MVSTEKQMNAKVQRIKEFIAIWPERGRQRELHAVP